MFQVLSFKFHNSGILKCARYAYMPNRLNLCGPDKNKNLFYYSVHPKEINRGLNEILAEFQTLYPYLKFIAQANKIKDIFDERVVEAYWLGNSLLDNIDKFKFYNYLLDGQKLKKKLPKKFLNIAMSKVKLGAKPHHSFHALNVWKRTGNLEEFHTLNSMDLCRISWGKIKKIDPPHLEVEYQPLVKENNRLKLGFLAPQKVLNEIDGSGFIKQPKIGQWVSMHWGFVCEILTKGQVASLKKYTEESMDLVNRR